MTSLIVKFGYKPHCPIEDKNQWSAYIRWFVETAPKVRKILLQYTPSASETDEDKDDSYPDDEEE